MDCDTLIVSDTHLGSPLSMARELLFILKRLTFHRLILLGDIFSDLNFSRLSKADWKLISYIRKLSNHKRGVEVVWVEGNHDAGVSAVMEHLLGVKVYHEYTWVWNDQTCLAMHGHQFDGIYASGKPWFDGLVTEVYLIVQRVGFVKKWLPRILDRFHTNYQRLTRKVADGALHRAAQVGAKYVFCGHTHEAYHATQNGVEYWNSGCWVGTSASYLMRTDVAKANWGENGLVPYGPYVAMKTAQGNVVPWLCSQTDLLATDWEIAE